MAKLEKGNIDFIKYILFTATDRKMVYLYTGIISDKNIIVLGNVDANDIEFGSPTDAICLIRFTNKDKLDMIVNFFKLFKINIYDNKPQSINLKHISAFVNKIKWDFDNVSYETNKLKQILLRKLDIESATINTHMETYFTCIRLEEKIQLFLNGLYDQHVSFIHELTHLNKTHKNILIYLTNDTFKSSEFNNSVRGYLKFIISKGLEILTPIKKEEETSHKLKLWHSEGNKINFVGYIKNDDYEIMCGKINTYTVNTFKRILK